VEASDRVRTAVRGRLVLEGDLRYLELSDGRSFDLEDLIPLDARPPMGAAIGRYGRFEIEVRFAPSEEREGRRQ